jgi:hypothetical protein
MLKKVFITSIIFLVLALGVAGYVIFFGKNNQAPTSTIANPDSPFGPGSGTRNPTGASTGTGEGTVVVPTNGITQLSNVPSASGLVYNLGITTLVRFVERGQGNMFELNIRTGTSTRLSSTMLPKIQETIWSNKGDSVLLRYISESNSVRTYAATLGKKIGTSTSLRDLKGSFLPSGIESIVASPDLKKIFYLERTSSGIRGTIANFDGSSRRQILSSAFGEWNVAWPEATTITLTTKAASGIPGYMYFLNTSTGSMKKVLGPIYGLTTKTSPNLNYVAYADSSATLYVYNAKTGVSNNLVVQTFTDKCAWAPKKKATIYCAVPESLLNSSYPEAWYQGKVQALMTHFSK